MVFNATLKTIFQLYRGGHFIGGGIHITRRKPLTCRNFITIKLYQVHNISGDMQ